MIRSQGLLTTKNLLDILHLQMDHTSVDLVFIKGVMNATCYFGTFTESVEETTRRLEVVSKLWDCMLYMQYNTYSRCSSFFAYASKGAWNGLHAVVHCFWVQGDPITSIS